MPELVPRNFNSNWSLDESRKRTLANLAGADAELKSGRLNFSEQLDPKFDYGQRAGEVGQQAYDLANQSAINSAQNAVQSILNSQQGPVAPNTPQLGSALNVGSQDSNGSPRLKAVLRALRAQESGGNYSAVNKDSGALGAYQVMPKNLGGQGSGWDYEALGRDLTPQQFLASKKLQNKVARYKFGQYLKKYGLQGALSSWYSGSPTRWNEKTPQGTYPSVRDYVLQVMNRL